MGCIICTVGYPSRRQKSEGEELPCTLNKIRHLQRDDKRPDLSGPEEYHVRPDGKAKDIMGTVREMKGEVPTLHCHDCPKRCGQPSIHMSGLSLCKKHLRECGYILPIETKSTLKRGEADTMKGGWK